METKTINELKLEITNLKLKRVEIIGRFCEKIDTETEKALRISKKEIEFEIDAIEKLISQKKDVAQNILNRSLNQSKL